MIVVAPDLAARCAAVILVRMPPFALQADAVLIEEERSAFGYDDVGSAGSAVPGYLGMALRLPIHVLGALLALVIVGPGLLGTVLVTSGMAGAGLLLGPLPAVLTGALGLSGVPGTADMVFAGAGMNGGEDLGVILLSYALLTQALAGLLIRR